GFAALTLVLGGAVPTRADVVYDNGPPDPTMGNEMTHWIQAESFSLTASNVINAVRFWDNQLSGAYNGSIYYAFAADSAGSPGAVLTSDTISTVTRTNTGLTFGAFTTFQNDFTIPALTLAAGNYWLELHNGPLTHQTSDGFYWSGSTAGTPPPGHELIAPFTGPWVSNGTEHAFQLLNNAPVPEPSALALLGL